MLGPSSGRGGTDREAGTCSTSRFSVLFSFGVASGYLSQRNSEQQTTASIANQGQHDFEGYFRKRESVKQPLKLVQPVRKAGCAPTAEIKQSRWRVSKRIKTREHKIWMQACSVTGYSRLFVRTNPVKPTGEDLLMQASPTLFRLFNTSVGSTLGVAF